MYNSVDEDPSMISAYNTCLFWIYICAKEIILILIVGDDYDHYGSIS